MPLVRVPNGGSRNLLAWGVTDSRLVLAINNESGNAYVYGLTVNNTLTIGGYTLEATNGQAYLTAPIKCVVQTGTNAINLTANTRTYIGSSTMAFFITKS